MYDAIPMELRDRLQWAAAGNDKIPINPNTGRAASVSDPGTWGSFSQACNAGLPHVGFMLSASDPYCIIDLDNKPDRPLSADEWSLHQKILTHFTTYTERSAGGLGYHLICRGVLDKGYHTGSTEVYSSGRFMICTGNVVRHAPIIEAQDLLNGLIAGLDAVGGKGSFRSLREVESPWTDAQVHERGLRAMNGDKYAILCDGPWESLGYPSQSEADFALLSMLCLYSPSNAQVRRVFRCTQLGRRDKAERDDYLDRAIAHIRAKHAAEEADLQQVKEDAQRFMRPPVPIPPAPAPVAPRAIVPPPPKRVHPMIGDMRLPPGLVGDLASYIYTASMRPVPEVAMGGALGFLAGLMGRAYNISNSGLNQYLLIVGKTGVGKEDAPRAIERLARMMQSRIPAIMEFLGPGNFASEPALVRELSTRPCFVSMLGEFGLRLQQLNDRRATGSTVALKGALLTLYNKSGRDQFHAGTSYSDKDKNIQALDAPALTLLGDSTPETFFGALNMADLENGLVPRFLILEYKGKRPPYNERAGEAPSDALLERLLQVGTIALSMRQNGTCCCVPMAEDAASFLLAFSEQCDAAINEASETHVADLWSRAHLKVLRLAALVAAGVNPHSPVVDMPAAEWAVWMVERSTRSILARAEQGDLGNGESKQRAEVLRVIEEYYQYNGRTLHQYRADKDMQEAGWFPLHYLSVRTARLSCFRDDRRGQGLALKHLLNTLVECGVLQELPAMQAWEKFHKKGKLYARGEAWGRDV